MDLYHASYDNNYKSVEVLIKRGNKNIENALKGACEGSHLELVKIFVPYVPLENYNEIFFYYIGLHNNKHIFDYLIKNVVGVNEYILSWYLSGACEGCHIDTVKYILGLDVLRPNYLLNNAFTYACKGGSLDIVQLLISAGANDWDHGLKGACQGGHIEIVKFMLKKYIPYFNKDVSFHYACQSGSLELVQFLIDNGYNYWNDGLCGACEGGSLELVELMISKGANYWNDGLRDACQQGHYNIVQFLLSKGAYHVESGLFNAYKYGHRHIVHYLIKKYTFSINNITEHQYVYENHLFKKIYKYFFQTNKKAFKCFLNIQINNLQVLPVNNDIQLMIF